MLYQATRVTVKVNGGETVAYNACVADARDGLIQSQRRACDLIATAVDGLQLENVSVYVQPDPFRYPARYQNPAATVELTGGTAVAANRCLTDAKDGVIQRWLAQCRAVPINGNSAKFDDVTVTITIPGIGDY